MTHLSRNYHPFIASDIVDSCFTLANNTYNELVILPGIGFSTALRVCVSVIVYRAPQHVHA